MTPQRLEQGVQELIDRLRTKGVEAGRQEADALLEQARHEAREVRTNAKREAEATLAHAREEIERLEKASREALQLAARDAVLKLKGRLREQFAEKLREAVRHRLDDRDLLTDMIREIARRSVPAGAADQPREVLLPEDVPRFEGDTEGGHRRGEAPLLDDLAGRLGEELLREGVTLREGDHDHGIRLRFVNDEVAVELTDEAVAALLLEHLLPRFRALLEGVAR